MSLSDEERAILVRLEMEKAHRAYDEAMTLMEKEYWGGTAGRIYYALYHAVAALLIHDHHQVKSHKGSHILFSDYYVRSGKISTQYGRLYSQLEAMRESSEYNCIYEVDPEELLKKIAPTKEMIDLIEAMLVND